MSDNRSTERRVIIRSPPANRVVADRLSHPATVVHPTITGDDAEFEVIIERVYYRTEANEPERLCFRGKATAGSWTGYKTFFADECRSVIDRASGAAIGNVADWLKTLRAIIAPLTLESLIRAVTGYLERDLGIKIGKAGASTSADDTTISFTEITCAGDAWDEEAPYDELQFFLAGLKVGSSADPITVDPLLVTIVESVGPPETATEEIDGVIVTKTTSRIPTKFVIEVTPCAGGRVDIRRAR